MAAPVVEAAIRELYGDLLDAWNRRDAVAFASLFAADGVSIGFDGSTVRGAEIVGHLSSVFRDHPTAAYVAKVRSVRPLGDGRALLLALAGMLPPGQKTVNPAVNALHALVAERDQSRLRVVLFQNTPAQHHGHPELVDADTAELERALEGERDT